MPTSEVCSPALLVDGFTQFTDLLTQTYGLETDKWLVIPLILRPVNLPPRLAVLIALDARDPADHARAIERLCTELPRPVPGPAPRLACPYPGMVPFREDDSDRFFGREREVEELWQSLRLHPFLAVIGPSGSGKSSLVFAGLIPALRRSGLFGAGQWLVRTLRPGAKPLAALANALGGDSADPGRAVSQALTAQPDTRRLLLVVDQFEELFTVAHIDAVAFQHALRHLAETPDAYVIVTARADFYPDLMVSPLWLEIKAHRVEVVPLDEEGLRKAIVRPAKAVEVFVEEVLVERLVADAAGEPGVLPLVQETLVLLWERLERRFLPLRAYEALTLPRGIPGTSGGERTGLQVAMARRADAALAALTTPAQQAIARRIFLRLVQFGEGRADTRRQQTAAELSDGSDPALFELTLKLLTDRRLLTTSGDERTASRRVDLAHEALISGWPQLQEWLGERREAEQTRRRLDAKAAEWVRRGRGTGGLLDRDELPEAEQWLASPDAADLGYSETLLKLIKASRDAVDKAEREREEIIREREARQLKRQADADGWVNALESAEISVVPEIISRLGEDLRLVEHRLRSMAQADDTTPGGSRRRLHAALALLPHDPTQVDYLGDRLLQVDARPSELLVIRQALYDHGHAPNLTPKLRALLEQTPTGLIDSQLRAAGALALFEPKDPGWPTLGPQVAAKLVQQNPLLMGDWREAFQAVAPALTTPLLRQHVADRSQPEQRALAFTFLFEFATKTQADDPRRTKDLAELIGEADPGQQFEQVLETLQADRARAIDLLAGKLDKLAWFDDALARRQGQWATALVRLGESKRIWPLLRHSDDPSLRTDLIHDLARSRAKVNEVITRLKVEEVSARRALILALGEYPADQIPAGERKALASMLEAWYREDPDPGVHGGIDWLLRQKWGQAEALDRIDGELAGREPPEGRHWYINGQGQTYAVIRGPVEFRMGSPENEADRAPNELPHRKRIARSFALATKAVTVAEYTRFLKENPDVAKYLDDSTFKQEIPSSDCAMGAVDWYDAARYCNWLSRKEGIPKDQWCYPRKIGPGMKLPADHLDRIGYRLPTEAEWEYACRAGSAAARPYGGSEAWLSEYGWYLSNAGRQMHPVGGKKPNDLGLFDVLGNVYEWTLDPYDAYQPDQGNNPSVDALHQAEFSDQVGRVLRGGSFNDSAQALRSANRGRIRPTDRAILNGLRPARTYP